MEMHTINPPRSTRKQIILHSAYPNFNYPPPNGYPSYADVSQPSEAPTAQSSALPEQSTEDPHAVTIEYALFYLSNRFTNSLIL
jgi:hypothetical protein